MTSIKNIITISIILIILVTSCKTPQPTQQQPKPNNHGIIENRKLEWSDFQGEIDPNSHYDAFTRWEVYYRYPYPTFEGDTAILQFQVWRKLNTESSWLNPNTKVDKTALLNHEQGHYDIAGLCAKELKFELENNDYLKSNYTYKIDSIYWEVLHKYLQLERQYDFETDHFYNKENQEKWDSFFKGVHKK